MKKREIKAVLKQLDNMELPEKGAMLDGCTIPERNYGAKRRPSQRRRLLPIIATAAFFVLIFVTACTIDEIEHQKAVRFFNEHGLETEGLSRAELRQVHKDITSGSFSLEATSEIIIHEVYGYEVVYGRPTPNDLKELWNRQFGVPKETAGVLYKYYPIDPNASSGERYTVEKYIDGEEIYKINLPKNRVVISHTEYGSDALVFGMLCGGDIGSTSSNGWAALIDEYGNIVWEKPVYNGFKREQVTCAVMDSEGVTLFSMGDSKYICVTELDGSGETLSVNKYEYHYGRVRIAARLEGGYLICLAGGFSGGQVAYISPDGSLSDTLSYDMDGRRCIINGIAEYNGSVYLSGYSVSTGSNSQSGSYFDEIRPVLDEVHAGGKAEFPGDELTELMRKNYTAVLLVFDRETGKPHEFYSVEGALGKSLDLTDDGGLLWKVEVIEGESTYSPATSAFSIISPTLIYDYVFSSSGELDHIRATGEKNRLFR